MRRRVPGEEKSRRRGEELSLKSNNPTPRVGNKEERREIRETSEDDGGEIHVHSCMFRFPAVRKAQQKWEKKDEAG